MNALVLVIALPLLGAFLLRPLARLSTTLAAITGPAILLWCAWFLFAAWSGYTGTPAVVALGGFAPPLGVVLYVDRMALLFALAVPLFALLFWPRGGTQAVRERALMLLLVAAACGLALSGDLFNLYVFYELTAVAGFGLMAASGHARAQLASLRYLMLSGFGSVIALVGIAIVYMQTGTLNLAQLAQLAPASLAGPLGLAAFAALLIGFGVKAELFPVNTWVPEVYATAPARLSALLAGLVSKLAVLVVVRLLALVFPQPEAMQLMLLLGVLGMVSGELAAWRARDFRRMIALSSVGQLGIVFIAFSVSGSAGVLAGLAVALHHLLVKPALFSLASHWQGSLAGLAGAARGSPLAAGLFALFALSLVGVPPLPGFWTKLLVLTGLAADGSALHWLAFTAILAVTVVEANYLFRVAVRLYADADRPPAPMPWRDTAGAALLGAALIAVTVQIAPVADYLRGVADEAADPAHYVQAVFPAGGAAP